MLVVRSLTRRQVIQAGAVAAAATGLRPAVPALAARPESLFEMSLDGAVEARSAAAGWQTTKVFTAPRRFDLVGLVWARGSHAEAQLRARRRGGRWTDWVALHDSGDHAPDDERAPAGTDPAFVGAADEFQLRLRGAPRELRARFVRALPTARLATRLGRRRRGRGARSAQAGAPPTIIPRAAWGADSVPPREAPAYGEVQIAFVHHTVTANDYGPEDSAAIVLGIARFHRNSNGWNDIGYNFLVDKYGQVFEGRAGGIDQAVVGAQAQGYNSVSTGIACLGDFTSIAQTPEGMDALARLIAWKATVHAIPTEGQITVVSAGGDTNRYPTGTPVTFERISGHRDGNNTACPGDVLYTQLAQLRSAVAQFAGPAVGLSLYAPREIRGVKPTVVSGSLRFPDGSAAAGAAIAVEHLVNSGAAAWEPVASAVAGADGSWETTVELRAGGQLRAVFAGDSTRARVESAPRRVTVLARLNLTLDRKRLRLGQRVNLGGTADPATHVRLTLQLRSRRRWLTARRRLIRVRGGTYRAFMRPRGRGKYRISAQVGRIVRRRTIKVF
jgi:hypothetical protein